MQTDASRRTRRAVATSQRSSTRSESTVRTSPPATSNVSMPRTSRKAWSACRRRPDVVVTTPSGDRDDLDSIGRPRAGIAVTHPLTAPAKTSSGPVTSSDCTPS